MSDLPISNMNPFLGNYYFSFHYSEYCFLHLESVDLCDVYDVTVLPLSRCSVNSIYIFYHCGSKSSFSITVPYAVQPASY